jgi:predicted HTH transcriptional regulator
MMHPDLDYYASLFKELCKHSKETEWLEFKHNNTEPDTVGEYISALANSAALCGKGHGYLLWGIKDESHDIVGTTFSPALSKVGNEELESWLLRLLTPKINFSFIPLEINNQQVILLEIESASRHPVKFKDQEFIRVGSYKKKLKEYPEKERSLWRIFDQTPFEEQLALKNITSDRVLQLLDYSSFFDLLVSPFPPSADNILGALEDNGMVAKNDAATWDVTNLGAVLFAKDLSKFRTLKRKTVRVVIYKANSRVETVREKEFSKGYACGFEGVIDYIMNLLPSNEVIGQALRKEVPLFPELAIRELVANALIHQDFYQTGTGPMIEIFQNRMEITNPGLPLVKTERFLDSPPKSRNEALASFMRRIGVCEERGSGIDKVVAQTEAYHLPAPLFEVTDEHTRVVLFSHRDLKDMDKEDRIRATYLHACLKYVQRDYMTNASLRERFRIEPQNSAIASRIIKDALEYQAICPYDDAASKKYMKYIPSWAS